MVSRAIKADTIRAIDGTSVTDTYADLGDSLSEIWSMLTIKNTTDVTIFISENSSDDHYELPAFTTESYDLQANYPWQAVAGKEIGTQFAVKANVGALPTEGRVILQGQYI